MKQQSINKVGVVFFVLFDIITEFKMAFEKTMFCVFLFLQVLTGACHGQAEGNKKPPVKHGLLQVPFYSDETAKKPNLSQTRLQ